MTAITHKDAHSRYHRALWPLMAVYVVAILGGTYGLSQLEDPPLWLNTAAALLVSLPLVATLAAIFRYAQEADEYISAQQFKALAFAGLATTGIVFTVGFLQMFDVLSDIQVFWFGPLYFIAYALGGKLFHTSTCA